MRVPPGKRDGERREWLHALAVAVVAGAGRATSPGPRTADKALAWAGEITAEGAEHQGKEGRGVHVP